MVHIRLLLQKHLFLPADKFCHSELLFQAKELAEAVLVNLVEHGVGGDTAAEYVSCSSLDSEPSFLITIKINLNVWLYGT